MDQVALLQASAACARSLRANLKLIGGEAGRPRRVLSAGSKQFSSVWTRDFCFAAGGLLVAGEAAAVRDTLEEILAHQRDDGLLPRLLDSHFWGMRFARALIGGAVPLRHPLAPNYTSDHFVKPIDSNSLVVWTAARYALHTGNWAWAGLTLPKLEQALAYYATLSRDGLICQPPFSDWKDTVAAREGAVFFTQLLRWKAMRSLSELLEAMGRGRAAQDWRSRSQSFARLVHRNFWEASGGFFADTLEHRLLSSDGNLAAIDWGFADGDEAALIHRAMDRKGLLTPWGPKAGERYPLGRKGWFAVLGGVPGYHDDYVWLWNTALELRVLRSLGKESRLAALVSSVAELIARTGHVSEVHRPEDGAEVRSWAYKSEKPFSWSAGMLLEAFHRLSDSAPAAEPSAGKTA